MNKILIKQWHCPLFATGFFMAGVLLPMTVLANQMIRPKIEKTSDPAKGHSKPATSVDQNEDSVSECVSEKEEAPSVKDQCPNGGEHHWTEDIKKASFKKDGMIYSKCAKCGQEDEECTVIPHAETIRLSKDTYVYNGKAKEPSVTILDQDGNEIECNCEVVYVDNVDAGQASVTVKLHGECYKGSDTVSFTIAPKQATPKIKLSQTEFVYNGERQIPEVMTVKVGKRTLTEDEYDVTFSEQSTNVGTYKVEVTLKGNYAGSAEDSYEIIA